MKSPTLALAAAAALVLAVGCATTTSPTDTPIDHPANPDAPEASVSAPSRTLTIDSATQPESGVAQDAATVDSPEAQGTTYTCPMHKEVVSSQPGKCPKCGMKLVPKKQAAESQPNPDPSAHEGHGGHP